MNNKGLSLLEILIAATILAFISFGIVQITDNSFKTRDRIIGEDKEFLQVETAMSRLQEDILQMYSPLYFAAKAPPAPLEVEAFSRYEGSATFSSVTTLGHPIPIFQNPDRYTFEFFTFSNKRRSEDMKQSNYAWVRYTLMAKEKNSTAAQANANTAAERESESEVASKSNKGLYDLVRGYTAKDPFSLEKIDWDKIKLFTLLPNVTAFEFSFWDESKKKFVETLKELKKDSVVRAVKVKFTWIGKGGVEYNDERIFKSIWPYIKFKEAEDSEKKKTKIPGMPGTTPEGEGSAGVGVGATGEIPGTSGTSIIDTSKKVNNDDDVEEEAN
ncbi:MAG: hypothetical protein HQK51_11500 [Oligoflexia bacterium]|nr:hypothetical protein [Oligoflexia bacterium]